MANFSELKAEIKAKIKPNGEGAITGQVMQDTMLSVVDTTDAKLTELSEETEEINNVLDAIAVKGEPSPNLFEPTIRGMFYSQYGSEIKTDTGLCQILSVKDGDKLQFCVWQSGQYIAQKVNIVAPYSNGVNKGGLGAGDVSEYIVPSGIDEVRIGISYSEESTNICVLKNADSYPSEKVLYGSVVKIKTDDTLSNNDLPANAKSVGDAINAVSEQASTLPLKLSRKDWTSENADKDNIYKSEDDSNIIHAVNERYATLREVKRMTDDDVLVQGYCGYYEDESGNVTPNTIEWKIYKGGILYIGGYGKFYDFVKGVECCKTIAEVNAEVARMGKDYWYYGFNANNVNGISTPFGIDDQTHGGDVMQYQPKRYVPFGEEINADNGKPKGYAAPWYQYRNEVSMFDGMSPDDDQYTLHDEYDAKNPKGIYYDRVCIEEYLSNGGITYLGDWTFYRCCVDSLVLPTRLQKIGAWGVRYSPTMRTLVMYDGVTEVEDHGISRHLAMVTLRVSASLNKVGYQSLGQNPCIKHIELPSTLTTAAKNLFLGNSCLESIVAQGITELPKDFANNCKNLSRVELGNVTRYGISSLFKTRINELTLSKDVVSIEEGTFVDAKIEYLTIDNPAIFSTIDTGNSHGNILNVAKRYYVPQGTPGGNVVRFFYEKIATENGYDIYQKMVTNS